MTDLRDDGKTWTPPQTLARQVVEEMHSKGLMRIEVGPGGKKRQQAYAIVERAIMLVCNELNDPFA